MVLEDIHQSDLIISFLAFGTVWTVRIIAKNITDFFSVLRYESLLFTRLMLLSLFLYLLCDL